MVLLGVNVNRRDSGSVEVVNVRREARLARRDCGRHLRATRISARKCRGFLEARLFLTNGALCGVAHEPVFSLGDTLAQVEARGGAAGTGVAAAISVSISPLASAPGLFDEPLDATAPPQGLGRAVCEMNRLIAMLTKLLRR